MNHTCEWCGAAHAKPFHVFEIESFGLPEELEQGKETYYLCLPCYDKITDAPLQTAEVKQRMEENKRNLEKLIQEGLICPVCKTPILDDPHHCEANQ